MANTKNADADVQDDAPPATTLPRGFPDPELAQTYDSVLDLVGNTPLVRVNNLHDNPLATVYVKLDEFNIGGSSKDRIGVNIVRQAITDGALRPGQHIIDTGAGNTAIGYALAGNATGHSLTTIGTEKLSPEKKALLEFLGVEILRGRQDVPRTDPENWASIAERHEAEDANTWWARQESTAANPAAHVASTGPEIWNQTGGQITHFLAAIATGGTVSGTGRYLKDRNPSVNVIATEFSDGPHAKSNLLQVFHQESGWEDVERDFPENIDLDTIDDILLTEREQAIDFGWHVARSEGLILGLSSAVSLLQATRLAETATEPTVIVSFSADSGRDYLQREYNADWLRDNGLGRIADKYTLRGGSAPDRRQTRGRTSTSADDSRK